MKAAVFAYSRQGCQTARRIMACFPEDTWEAYTMARFGETGFLPFPGSGKAFYGQRFAGADALVFVGSCGIAVREIAPHVRDKRTDPAVLCVDELGTFVIPLLSGHIGGANDLARKLAWHLGATPVITTATDIHNRFSVDAWAKKQGFLIDSMSRAKAVSAAILEGDVPLSCDFPILSPYPQGVKPGEIGDVGICISYRIRNPFAKTLRLIPKILHLGIGCKRGTTAEQVAQAVDMALKQENLEKRALRCAASIDLKQEEPGLLQYCREQGLPVRFYSAQELMALPGEFTPSDFVRKTTGVENVCERAACMGAETLVVKKTALNGVTVAIAAEKWEVRFV